MAILTAMSVVKERQLQYYEFSILIGTV